MTTNITPYNCMKIKDRFLLINNAGSWVSLSEQSFQTLKKGDLDGSPELLKFLESSGFMPSPEVYNFEHNIPITKYSFLCQGPSLHIIILTDLCNLNCIYCQASSLKNSEFSKKMTAETAKKVADFIFQSSSKHITIEFQGGEPLINYDVIRFIIEYAKELNCDRKKELKFSLTTNFELIDESKLNYLIQNKVGLCISLDGPKELHDLQRICLNGSNYQTIVNKIENINNLKLQGKVPKNYTLYALTTITKRSFDCYKQIIDDYVRLGFDVIHLRYLNKIGAAKDKWHEIGYTAEEFVDFWRKSMDYIIELNKKGVIIKERFAFMILQKVLLHFEPNYSELRSPCGICISQQVYDVNGDIYSCDEGRMIKDGLFKIGDVNQTPSQVVTNETSVGLILSSINDLQQCEDCVWQPYCGLCPVCNYAEHKSLIVDVNKTMRCKVFKEIFKYLFEKILFDGEAKKVFISWLTSKKTKDI